MNALVEETNTDRLLKVAMESSNIAASLDKETLDDIAEAVMTGYDIDEESRSKWKEKNKKAMKLAMQIWEEKHFPFENAANIQYPMLSIAAIQFSARAMPNFVKEFDVVKGKVIGEDPTGEKANQAKRVSTHMSYQCKTEMEEWEEDTDKLLTVLPILGCCFKKTWFSPNLERNVSEFRSPEHIVINYFAKSMKTVPRITEIYTLYPNEIEERKRQEIFLDVDLGEPTTTKNEDDEETVSTLDPDHPHVFLEQHTFYDLDGDGYKEPYIITVHKDTKKVVRITARFEVEGVKQDEEGKITKIDPIHYYTKFTFMNSPDGSIYDYGYGHLLEPINRTVNTTINQLTDSGTLHNSQSGFLGKGIQLGRGRGGGVLKFNLNEWKTVSFTGDDLRKNIFPMPTKEPSTVLFNLLGFMVEAGDRLSSVANIMSGLEGGANERPTTTLARIEQGLKVFSAIHKRLFKAFREEYQKLFRLNSIFLKPQQYFTILDDKQAIAQQDYNSKAMDVIPVADPNDLSTTQKLLKDQMLAEMQGQGFNDQEIRRRLLEAMQVDDVDKILNAPDPPPDPKMILEGAKLEHDRNKLKFEMDKFDFGRIEIWAKVQKTLAQAVEHIAKAEAAEIGPQLDQYKAELQTMATMASQENKKLNEGKSNGNNQG